MFGYCDSDYAACVDERLSVAGWVFMAAGGATSWQSQSRGPWHCPPSRLSIWRLVQRPRKAYGSAPSSLRQVCPPTVQCSSSRTIRRHGAGQNPNHHQRSKHIDVRYHYVRQQVAKRVIQLDYIATADQAADQLTKPLSQVQHDRCLAAMGIRSASASDSSPLTLYTPRS